MKIRGDDVDMVVLFASVAALAGGCSASEAVELAHELLQELDASGWIETREARLARWRNARRKAKKDASSKIAYGYGEPQFEPWHHKEAVLDEAEAAGKAAYDSFPSFKEWSNWDEDDSDTREA